MATRNRVKGAPKGKAPQQGFFNLGDPQVAKVATTMNMYMFCVFYAIIAIVMLCAKAWLTAFIFAFLSFICFPKVKVVLESYHIKGVVKFLVCVGLLYLAFMSSGLYVG